MCNSSSSQSNRHAALYQEFEPLVRRIARAFARRVPAFITLDDLISAGHLGLAQVIERYRDEEDLTYVRACAVQRIRGAMIDELRHHDNMTRLDRRKHRELKRIKERLTTQLGHSIPPEKVAQEAAVPLAEYQRLQAAADSAAHTKDLDATNADEFFSSLATPDAAERVDARRVAELVSELPERLQLVLRLNFAEDLNLREVGEKLGVSESRAHQMRREAFELLKRRLSSAAFNKRQARAPQGMALQAA